MSQQFSRRAAMMTGLGATAAAIGGCATQSSTPSAAAPLPGALPGALAQNYSVIYHNPDPRLYVEGCGIERLDDGTLVAVVPIVPRSVNRSVPRVGNSWTHILRSTDGGATWLPASKLPYYSARPWRHAGQLYLFAFEPGTTHRNNSLLLLRSADGGRTWSDPVLLFKGHFWNAHTGMVIRDGKAYWCFDDIARSTTQQRDVRVIAGDLADPMAPGSWRISNNAAFPGVPTLMGAAKFETKGNMVLEPNLIDVRGNLRVVACAKLRGQTISNLAAHYDVTDDSRKLEVRFTQYHPMPGAQLKFCIIRDEVSRMFWATANLVADSQEAMDWWDAARGTGRYRSGSSGGNDRRTLGLFYGVDGLNWFQAGVVVQAPKLSQSFMYATPVIDGDDLAIICRSSIRAPEQHDADHATFHRVRGFRRLAVNLHPQPEA